MADTSESLALARNALSSSQEYSGPTWARTAVDGIERKARSGSRVVVVVDAVHRLDHRQCVDLLGDTGGKVAHLESAELGRPAGLHGVKLSTGDGCGNEGPVANDAIFIV